MSVPVNASDPLIAEWSQPETIVASTQGIQLLYMDGFEMFWEDPPEAR